MRKTLVAISLCVTLGSAWALQAQDFALQLALEVPAGASLLRLPLSADVYRATRRADLGDVRVFNAAGEALPMARLPSPRGEHLFRAMVALSPLPAAPGHSGAAAEVSVERRAGDTRVHVELGPGMQRKLPPARFLADTEGFARRVHALRIALPAEAQFEGQLMVETSSDLARWRTLASSEAILAVGRGAERLVRDRVELGGAADRYLRLSWLGAPPAAMPAQLELIHKARREGPQREWLALEGRASGEHFDYQSPGLFPVDQLRLLPTSGSDVLAARVSSRAGVSQRWQPRAHSVGYRLEGNGAVREGRPVSLALSRDPLWRASPELAETAGAAPLLELGWVPEEMVFVARGAGPYLIAVGGPDIAPAWLGPDRVIPGYGTDRELVLSEARIVAPGQAVKPAPRPASLWQAGGHWWLWAALGLGVAVLGWMARGVWRELGRRTP